MDQVHRQEYLRALGIDPWVLRSSDDQEMVDTQITDAEPGAQAGVAPASDTVSDIGCWRLHIGPGTGNTLILCATAQEAASLLAADISRSLDCEPVWAWQDDSEAALSLEQAVQQRLFTRILVLYGGQEKINRDEEREVIASARVLRSRSITELASDGRAKQKLWAELCNRNWCADRARKPGGPDS